MTASHYPVMRDEAIEALAIQPTGRYIDGTFGRGGHSRAILERLGPQGRLLAIDQDPEAVVWAKKVLQDPRFTIVQGNFAQLAELVERQGWLGEVDGILLDVGVSSPQLDQPERGFSFLREGPLDMRMNPDEGMDARTWLKQMDQKTLEKVLRQYGEERFAGRIARRIKEALAENKLWTTTELASLVAETVPRKERHKHPATRTFQAIRIAVNQELEALQEALKQSVEVLKPGGRLVVISFHSLEDRLVKRFMRHQSSLPAMQGLPGFDEQVKPKMKPLGKPRFPSEQELQENPRSRSAVMRVAERI